MRMVDSSNQKSYDLLTIDGDLRVSCKCMSSKVRFQDSRFTVYGHICTMEELRDSLLATDLVQVMDIESFPSISIVAVQASDLVVECDAGRLTPNGWSNKRFYEFLQRMYALKIKVLASFQAT